MLNGDVGLLTMTGATVTGASQLFTTPFCPLDRVLHLARSKTDTYVGGGEYRATKHHIR